MDKVAKTIGLTPDEFRRRNFVQEGETTATSQLIREKVDMDHLLDRAFELTGYHEIDPLGSTTLSFGPQIADVAFMKMIGSAGTGMLDSAA